MDEVGIIYEIRDEARDGLRLHPFTKLGNVGAFVLG